MIGTTIGKYRIIEPLGRGATGIVYRAVDETLDREVAIKVLDPLFSAGGDVVKRFHTEATTLARLSHPEIATIHELLRTDFGMLMVMELVRGETLEFLAERSGPMSPQLAGRIIDGILSALEHAHRAGVVHRDLKPANVMVTEHGGVKIMDFGIARVRGAAHMTNDGCAVGTPAYMAPEQVLGDDVDGRADLYAVGLIFYRLLAGTLPFETDNAMTMLQKQVSELPRPLRTHRQDLPDWCDAIVAGALAKAPRDRYQTAEDFRADIARAMGLTPAVDLAKAFHVPTRDRAAGKASLHSSKTIPISRSQVRLRPARPTDRFARLFAQVRAVPVLPTLRRAQAVAANFGTGPLLIAVCALGVLAHWTATTLGTTAEAERRRSDTASASISRTREPERESDASEARTTGAAPVVFRAKLVFQDEGKRRESDARLSFARDRLVVTATHLPDDPVFAAAYRDVTGIEHARQPGWKPPQKWSKVVKIGDDVLGTLGVRDRHEISVRAESDLVVFRVEDDIVNRVLRALKERTGLSPGLVSSR